MTPEAKTSTQPTPALLFDTLNAHQRTEAIKTAIELDLFTAIAEGKTKASEIAEACEASVRGIRILCDYLVIIGFLTKADNLYGLTQDSATFLDKHSPAYMGTVIEFILSPHVIDNFRDFTNSVKRGGSAPDAASIQPDSIMWVKFARAMAPMMAMPSQLLAPLIDPDAKDKLKILDIAAGHGIFGITFAQRNPSAEIAAVDWAPVLAVATENAKAMGVADRHRTIPGDAFKVDYGSGYDVALLTNFLHHFDRDTNVSLLRKTAAALKKGGRIVVLEMVPNEDRVSPPFPAGFALTMLAGTPAGDAFTLNEIQEMLTAAGFGRASSHPLPTPETVVIAGK